MFRYHAASSACLSTRIFLRRCLLPRHCLVGSHERLWTPLCRRWVTPRPLEGWRALWSGDAKVYGKYGQSWRKHRNKVAARDKLNAKVSRASAGAVVKAGDLVWVRESGSTLHLTGQGSKLEHEKRLGRPLESQGSPTIRFERGSGNGKTTTSSRRSTYNQRDQALPCELSGSTQHSGGRACLASLAGKFPFAR